MAYSPASISPAEATQFGAQRAQARRRLTSGQAENDYRRQLLGLNYTQKRNDLGRQWDARRVSLPTSYIQRGLFRSGIYGGALQDYGQNRLGAFSDLENQYQQGLGDLIFGGRALEDDYADAVSANYLNELSRRAATAAALRNVL